VGFWYYFWTANFVVAGSAFLVITLIVSVRGGKDLRDMFARLKASSAAQESNAPNEKTKP
jgi:hypothetical protein